MKKNICTIILVVVCCIFTLSLLIYFWVVGYYKDKFLINTWINDVYCTGKTVDEVNNELLRYCKIPYIVLYGANGEQEIISFSDAEYYQDLSPVLNSHLDAQKAMHWPLEMGNEKRISVEPITIWNEELLHEMIVNSSVVQNNLRDLSTIDVKIIYGENGYELYDGMSGVFDPDVYADKVIENYLNGILYTDITDEAFYYVENDSSKQEKERILWDRLDTFLDTGFVLDMGAEKYVFDKKITSDFILLNEKGEFVLDENGSFIFDNEKIRVYLSELLQKYNTVGTNLKFRTTNGDFVEVKYNKYGTEIDVEAEVEYILNALNTGISETYIPTYKQEGYVRGLNDIGNTYIEVDMTMQKLYGYKDGEMVVETDVVTGNMRRGWDTPAGVNYVYAKQKKRILRGDNYATPVDYWMPVVGNIGLHDANWRSEFGGDIYQTDGSHGCVNIPSDIMPTIYETFEIGTPVIMFYQFSVMFFDEFLQNFNNAVD